MEKEEANLTALSKKQKNTAASDAIGVFLISAPAASLTGNVKEGLVAVTKGKILSIGSRMKITNPAADEKQTRKCRTPWSSYNKA